jgi:endonuclease G
LEHKLYTASYNKQTKFSDWVAYAVTAKFISDNEDRRFKPDPNLADKDRLETADFEEAFQHGLKYEIGHQAPLNSLGDGIGWEELNYLSNVTPQKEPVNSGVWRALEAWEERLITEKGFKKVYVITGPLYLDSMKPLPRADEAHVVPSGYWKVISVEVKEGFIFSAVVIPQSHKAGSETFCGYGKETSIDDIELATRLNLFPELSSKDEKVIEPDKGGEVLPLMGCR